MKSQVICSINKNSPFPADTPETGCFDFYKKNVKTPYAPNITKIIPAKIEIIFRVLDFFPKTINRIPAIRAIKKIKNIVHFLLY